jgi:hypothetical protein
VGGPLPGGATLAEGDGRAWTLIDEPSPSRFGAAVVWALRQGSAKLHVLVEGGAAAGREAAAVIARRAPLFALPIEVVTVEGRRLEGTRPTPPPQDTPPAPAARPLMDLMAAHGVDPVVEYGTVKGEVLGLEVARVVGDRLEVGVGVHDRQARAGLRPDEDLGAALDEVVALVRHWRAPGGRRHPANLISRERWLRAAVLGRPAVVGARVLDRRPPAVPVEDLRLSQPAAAAGADGDGEPVVVVCSTGVDLDLVPTAGDHRLIDGRRARLRVVVPEGDDYPVTHQMARALVEPAEVVTVPRDWPTLLT